jgi:hypothetical protein
VISSEVIHNNATGFVATPGVFIVNADSESGSTTGTTCHLLGMDQVNAMTLLDPEAKVISYTLVQPVHASRLALKESCLKRA